MKQGTIPHHKAVEELPAKAAVEEEVTRHQQTEQKLRDANAKITEILESITDAFSALDRNWRYTYVNDRAAFLLGKPKDELIGQCVWELYPDAVGSLSYQKCQQALRQQTALVFENYYPSSNKWFENHLYPSKDGLSIYWRDITERKRIEADLRENEARFWLAVEHFPGAFVLYDTDLRYKFVNARAIEMTGLSEQEFLGHTNEELFSPEFTHSFLALLRLAADSRTPQTAEFTLENQAGRSTHVIHYVPLLDDQGDIREICGITFDITARKRLEQEILEISEREQARIGRDLHDGLCQQLAGIAMLCWGLKKSLGGREKESAPVLEEIATLLEEATLQVRDVARGLYPVGRMHEGLASALEELANSVTRRFSVVCRVVCPAPVLISRDGVTTHLYRIAQEAISNAIKHGKARNVLLELEQGKDGSTSLTVSNDGLSFTRSPGGTGLHIMNYRAGVIGATLTVMPGSDGGTNVRCVVPGKGRCAAGEYPA